MVNPEEVKCESVAEADFQAFLNLAEEVVGI